VPNCGQDALVHDPVLAGFLNVQGAGISFALDQQQLSMSTNSDDVDMKWPDRWKDSLTLNSSL